MREIEIKLRVKDLGKLEKQLRGNGYALSPEIKQHDTVYSHRDDKNFSDAFEGHIAVRIRREDGAVKITLKQQRSNEMDNTEYETKVENGEVMHQILLKLGWKPEVEVKKVRKKGKLGEYEICLDNVEQLGSFVELEKMTDDAADPEKVRQELFAALKPFGLSEFDEETRGYDTQISLDYEIEI